MPKIKYSLELKLQVIKESLITKDLWKLSIKYNIISGPTLIRYWIKRYTNFNEQIGSMKEESAMRNPKKVQSNNYELFEEIEKLKLEKNHLEIELRKSKNEVKATETKLTNKMNKMEKQNNKEIESKNLKIKLLEKSIPSLLKLEMKEIAKTKFFKRQVYCLIYENEAASVLSIRNMCKELNLHKSKYLEWKTRHNYWHIKNYNNYI